MQTTTTEGDIEPNVVREYLCRDWDDFVAKVRGPTPRLATFPAVYRGHAKTEWLLWSKLDRQLAFTVRNKEGQPVVVGHAREPGRGKSFRQICDEILERFRKHIRTTPEVTSISSDLELWAVGRHVGLLTPLLDWTESPYVAAFFAFADAYQQFEPRVVRSIPLPTNTDCVRVWGLRFLEPDLERDGEFEFVRAMPSSAFRQRAQAGAFTVLWTEQFPELRGYLEHRGAAHCLEYYDIPIGSTLDALRDLQLMNVAPATLYPDLYGAAWQANIDTAEVGLHMLWRAEIEKIARNEGIETGGVTFVDD